MADGHPDVPLTVANEASNVLAVQISEGAPADVFISADRERPRRLAEAGHTAARAVPFARNRVTLVVPIRAGRVEAPVDLAEPGVRLVGTSPGAPITGYAHEALAQLAQAMPEPEAYAAAVADNTVSHEDNVRATLAKVELGEGDAAFVYGTDARSSERVREIGLPEAVDVTAEYAVVQVSDRARAASFVAWLGSAEATAIIEAAGFEAPALENPGA